MHRLRSRFATSILGVLLVLGAAPARALAQESGDLTTLIEEQDLLRRQLQRLKRSMESLVPRLEQEGRPRALELVRDGLKMLEERGDGTGRLTIEELMGKVREDVSAGQIALSLQHQEAIIEHLQRLLSILLDRQNMESLERSLEALKEIQAGLASLKAKEQELRQQTAKLRDDSASPLQKALEEDLARLAAAQRALLERNEAAGRASGQMALEQIERELEQLLAREQVDRAVLEAWQPDADERARDVTAQLDLARKAAARAARLRNAAVQLQRSAQAARDAKSPGEAQQANAALDQAAEREDRHQRASGDTTAKQTAEALQRAASALRNAGDDAAAREQAAQAAEQAAQALARDAAAQEAEAAHAREQARAELAANASKSPGEQAAEQALATEPGAGADPRALEAAAKATEEAAQALQRELDDQKRLGPALSASQNEAAEAAERLKRALESLPSPSQAGEQNAQSALSKAAEAMQQAASAARSQQSEPAAEQARAAEQALREAQQALAQAREARAKSASEAQAAASQQLAQEQQQLAQEAHSASSKAGQSSSMSAQAQSEVQKQLEQAQSAMQKSAGELSQGRASSAAASQRKASEALQAALDAAKNGVQPSAPEDQSKADLLAKEQAQVGKELLELATRNKERKNSKPNPSIDAAAAKAGEASESLDNGELDQAQQEEQETERKIDEALDDLTKEEQQYQKLRQEELLFRIAEEITNLIKAQSAALAQLREVDSARGADERLSRADRLRLRRIGGELTQTAARLGEVADAIEAEQSLVFGTVLREVRQDIERVARDIDEAGGNQTGDRPQGLLEDGIERSEWVLQALKDEQKRRQKDAPPPDEQQQQQKKKPPLVPDVAELKLLRQLEVDTLDAMARLRLANPELESSEVSPEILEDVLRLAGRHERTTKLFQLFRARLGLEGPEETKP